MCTSPIYTHLWFFTGPELISLETTVTITVSGSDAEVCVMTEGAAAIKLIMRDVNNSRDVKESMFCISMCSVKTERMLTLHLLVNFC